MCYTFRVFTRVLKARCLVIGAFFLGGSWGVRVLTLCNIAYLAEPDSGFSKLEAHVVAVVALRSNRRRQGPALGQPPRCGAGADCGGGGGGVASVGAGGGLVVAVAWFACVCVGCVVWRSGIILRWANIVWGKVFVITWRLEYNACVPTLARCNLGLYNLAWGKRRLRQHLAYELKPRGTNIQKWYRARWRHENHDLQTSEQPSGTSQMPLCPPPWAFWAL